MKFHQFSHHIIEVLSLVRYHAAAAVFDAVVQIKEVAAAILPHGVKRTVAKDAIVIILVYCSVAGKVLAVLMAEKLIFLCFLTEALVADSIEAITFVTLTHVNPDVFSHLDVFVKDEVRDKHFDGSPLLAL